ncbi:hypothetical protein AAAU27_13135 [Bacteroides ovatus]|uniref:Uncharacterized protein n=1 Tax=Bacteroides xylanisolvens TaxID=371601 RepID=A0A1Y4V5D4_9BACE|nr:hypothetical protein [Bacteroides xylanisolvens]OUQ64603.1 hypothetical protein B5E52_16850 [Bacteroides xylanisolvens]
MGMQSKTFEEEEKKVVNQATNKGVSWEVIAEIRAKYHNDFNQDRSRFESFKEQVENLSKDK